MPGARKLALPAPWLAAIVIGAIVVASVFAGVAFDRVLLHRSAATSLSMFPDTGFHPLSSVLRSPTPEERRRLRSQLATELSLTPAQDSAFDAIMMHRAGEFSALREEIRPRVERLVSDVRSDMEQVLTPEQRERFRRLQARDRDDARRMSSSTP
jgi:Spy/CpxP family protein refolding chaperone